MKIGFIGTGNMATAMINGIVKSEVVTCENIFVSDIDDQKLAEFENMGIKTATNNEFVAKNADYIFLTVKPQFYDVVLEDLKKFNNKIYITVAPGITTDYIKSQLGDGTKVVRTMPNTPALVGEGVTAVYKNDNVTEVEYSFAKKLICAFSQMFEMEENLLDPIISVSGSSPAYSYMFIDAIAKAGEKQGIDYNTALIMAAKTVLGSAKLLLSSTDDPKTLIDKVCSKGGTTIEAVNYLNDHNFDDIISDAMEKCTKRALELKKG